MRRLRALAGLPLLAGLLLSGAATTAAATPPVSPGLPGSLGMADLPYVNAEFPCYSPREETGPGTNGSLVTDESFVFLMPSTPAAPTVPGLPSFAVGQDLNFMKCFFHYREGTVPDAPYVEKGFPCAYPPETFTAPTTGDQKVYHTFAHSTFIVRDEFAILLCWGTASGADLSITKTDDQGGSSITSSVGSVGQDNDITYTITVTNSGPSAVTGATVSDTLPAKLTDVSYTAVGSTGASGYTASGTGNINDTVSLASGATITYKVEGLVDYQATGTLSNTATVTPPSGSSDPNLANNSATDTDTITGD